MLCLCYILNKYAFWYISTYDAIRVDNIMYTDNISSYTDNFSTYTDNLITYDAIRVDNIMYTDNL